MQIFLRAAGLAAVSSILLAACSNTHIPSPADLPIVYKIDIQQGNVITQDMLAQLQPGMDKAKVRYVMGTPLIVDVFHQDRWDYVFTEQKRGGTRHERHVSLYFKDDKLDHIEGDVKPAQGRIPVAGRRDTTVEVPLAEKSMVGKLKEKLEGSDKAAEDKAKAKAVAPASPSAGAPAAAAPAKTATPGATSVADQDKSAATTGTSGASPGKAVPKSEASAKNTSVVVIPDNAPKPPEKSLFRRLLEKIGVGDNENGEYQPADTKYKDPSNPDSGSTP